MASTKKGKSAGERDHDRLTPSEEAECVAFKAAGSPANWVPWPQNASKPVTVEPPEAVADAPFLVDPTAPQPERVSKKPLAYFERPWSETAKKVSKVLKFDLQESHRRLVGVLKADEIDEARRDAVLEVLSTIDGVVSMFGPEVGSRRDWLEELSAFERAIARIEAAAELRVREEGFEIGHATGTALRNRAAKLDHILALQRMLPSMRAAIAACQAAIPKGSHYGVPGMKPGRPPVDVLRRCEWLLSEAGYKPAEIAKLVIDSDRKDSTAAERTRHAARIRTRIGQYVPAPTASPQAERALLAISELPTLEQRVAAAKAFLAPDASKRPKKNRRKPG